MNYNYIINSCIGSGLAEIITYPVCTTKTNYQNTSSTSIVKTAKEIYKSSGSRAFYHGLISAVSSQMLSSSTKYVFYQYLKEQNYPYSNLIINGVISGIASSAITHPVDVIKIHLQMKKPFSPELKKHGIGLFYRGYSKSFFKVSVGSACFLPSNDYLNSIFDDNPILASFIAGLMSTLIIHPVDYLKTRHIYGQKIWQGFHPAIYYKGLSLNLLRTVPHFTIMMSIIAYLSKNPLIKSSEENLNN